MDFTENIVLSKEQSQEESQSSANANANANTNNVRITDIEVTNENVALNLLVSFLVLAQKRGVFSFDESAKIWECIKMFQKQP
jgi:hypothetical protein